MTTVVNKLEQARGTAPAAPASPEDLLGRVLDNETVAALAEQARQGVALLGEGGLLQHLTKRFLEPTLEGEMDAHLGPGPSRAWW